MSAADARSTASALLPAKKVELGLNPPGGARTGAACAKPVETTLSFMNTNAALNCPSCSAAIPFADVNVAKDIALCRACGATTSFSGLQGAGELKDVNLDVPPKHVRDVHDGQSDLVLTYRRRSPIFLFLIPFTALWSGGSVGMIYVRPLLQGKPFEVGEALFGIPFLIGTVVLLTVVTYLFFGRWVIRVTGNEGTVFNGVGSLGWTRRFTIDRSSTVTLAACGASVNDQPVPCIRIHTGDEKLSFGAFIKEDSKLYIAARLQHYAKTK